MASFANNNDLLQAVSLLHSFSPTSFMIGEKDSDSHSEMESENSNTSKKTRHDVTLFVSYLQNTKNENRSILDIEPDCLDSYIAEFLSTIRQKDQSQYEPSSLRSIFASLERYLKTNKYSYSLFNECRFEKAREALRSKQKELKQQGKGNRPNAARAITEEEQELLYTKGILGMHNAEALLNTVWWNVTRFFGMRAGAEQHKLQWGDVTLRTASNGIEFCEFNERQMKVRSGADLRTIGSVTPKMWAISNNSDNPRDPVAVYKKFSSMRPAVMKRPNSPFYLAINNSKEPDWFKCQPLGINTLKSLMKKMFTKAALPIKGAGKITNHSARKTMMESMREFIPESVSFVVLYFI